MFKPEQFAATEWDTAETKARFANKLRTFILAGFPQAKFDNPFYKRLSMTFGHIAHYDRGGFYAAQFSSTDARIRFLQNILSWPCHGSPLFTYSDVERAIKAWLRTVDVLEDLCKADLAERERRERALLAQLQAKYPEARP